MRLRYIDREKASRGKTQPRDPAMAALANLFAEPATTDTNYRLSSPC